MCGRRGCRGGMSIDELESSRRPGYRNGDTQQRAWVDDMLEGSATTRGRISNGIGQDKPGLSEAARVYRNGNRQQRAGIEAAVIKFLIVLHYQCNCVIVHWRSYYLCDA